MRRVVRGWSVVLEGRGGTDLRAEEVLGMVRASVEVLCGLVIGGR